MAPHPFSCAGSTGGISIALSVYGWPSVATTNVVSMLTGRVVFPSCSSALSSLVSFVLDLAVPSKVEQRAIRRRWIRSVARLVSIWTFTNERLKNQAMNVSLVRYAVSTESDHPIAVRFLSPSAYDDRATDVPIPAIEPSADVAVLRYFVSRKPEDSDPLSHD
jgi:hypothetical protein